MVSVGNGRSKGRPCLWRDILRIISTCVPGPGGPGGKWRRRTEGVGSVKDAWCYLPRLSLSPVRCPGGVRSRVAVRGEHRHDALALPSAARGIVQVARLTRLDGTVAGGRVNSTRRLRGRLSRVFLMCSENHLGEYRAVYMFCTRSHSSMVSLTMSAERGEGVLSARSRANLRETFE